MKILIVEDSKIVMNKIIDTLKSKSDGKKLKIFTASSKKECAKLILEHKGKFDIAILDLGLPDATNGEIVPFINKFFIPFIVLSASNLDRKSDIFFHENLIDYVIKKGSFSIEYASFLVHMFLSNNDYSVLIVDDSKSFATKVEHLCKKYNLNTYVKYTAKEALLELQTNKNIQLIFSDYIMPDMDGLAFVSEVRKKFKKDEISIIALSSSKERDVVAKFLKYGANDFIHKDFSNEEFYARLNSNLEIIKLFESTRNFAYKDYLTGMYNRRYFFEKGMEIYKEYKEKKLNLCMSLIDIDDFKNINDSYGHNVGDIALKNIPIILKKHLDERSLVARMGGEEFCVLTLDTSESEILKIYENIRKDFENLIITTDEVSFSFTVSTGLCIQYYKDIDDMIRKSDIALYEAKRTGKNNVVVYNTK